MSSAFLIAIAIFLGLGALVLGFFAILGAIAVFPFTVGCAIIGWLIAGTTGAIVGATLAGLMGAAFALNGT